MSAGESVPRFSRRAVLAGSAAAAIAAPALSGAAGTTSALDAMFRARIAETGISGAVAAFMRRGEAPIVLTAGYANLPFQEIGRASCRERVCQYVLLSGVAVSLQKKKIIKLN